MYQFIFVVFLLLLQVWCNVLNCGFCLFLPWMVWKKKKFHPSYLCVVMVVAGSVKMKWQYYIYVNVIEDAKIFWWNFGVPKVLKAKNVNNRSKRFVSLAGMEPENFVWEFQVATLIYLSRQPHIHIYIHFFIIYTLFYLISYIYTTHQTTTKRA